MHSSAAFPKEGLGNAAPTISSLFIETCLVAITKTYHLNKAKKASAWKIHWNISTSKATRCPNMCMLIISLCSPGMEIKNRHLFYLVKHEKTHRKVLPQGYKLWKEIFARPGKTFQTSNAFSSAMKTWNKKTVKGGNEDGGIYKNTNICDCSFSHIFPAPRLTKYCATFTRKEQDTVLPRRPWGK